MDLQINIEESCFKDLEALETSAGLEEKIGYNEIKGRVIMCACITGCRGLAEVHVRWPVYHHLYIYI